VTLALFTKGQDRRTCAVGHFPDNRGLKMKRFMRRHDLVGGINQVDDPL